MGTTYVVGESDQRPWGSWAVLAVGEGYARKGDHGESRRNPLAGSRIGIAPNIGPSSKA